MDLRGLQAYAQAAAQAGPAVMPLAELAAAAAAEQQRLLNLQAHAHFRALSGGGSGAESPAELEALQAALRYAWYTAVQCETA